MIKLGANILSQTVQRNLGRSTQDLSRASERLSSGQRINRASDDAAGLAISMSLDKDRILARMAQRNVSDGVSVVTIMTSGLKSQKEILFRMAELAEQSANGTYSTQQREVLQKEYSSLMDEFDRVADATEFNGVKLLKNPTPQTIQFMAGITGADTSLLQVAAANSHRYAGEYQIRLDWDGDELGGEFEDFAEFAGIFSGPDFSGDLTIKAKTSSNRDININLTFSQFYGQDENTGTISAYWVANDAANRSNYAFGAALSGVTSTTSTFTISGTLSGTGDSFTHTIDLSGTTYSADTTGEAPMPAGIVKPFEHSRPSSIGFSSILNQGKSRKALVSVKNRIDDLSAIEGQYGAIESRLVVAYNLLATSGENFAAAASRIKDADVAGEAANSIRSGILQQAATSLLAQANQAPQIALSLLRG